LNRRVAKIAKENRRFKCDFAFLGVLGDLVVQFSFFRSSFAQALQALDA
jgi:hypothetical protein